MSHLFMCFDHPWIKAVAERGRLICNLNDKCSVRFLYRVSVFMSICTYGDEMDMMREKK